MQCHSSPRVSRDGAATVLLIGPPNVGKSVVFNRLTGLGVSVANYAGTTVDYARGVGRFHEFDISLTDLPGTYTLSATNEAEQVATEMLNSDADLVIVVADALHLESSIYLVLQVLAVEKPTIVVLNRVDVAAAKGKRIDVSQLSRRLGVRVVPTIAVRGEGFDELEQVAAEALRTPRYPKAFEHDLWQEAEAIAAAVELYGAAAAALESSAPNAAGVSHSPHAPGEKRREHRLEATRSHHRLGAGRGVARRGPTRFDSESLVRPWPGFLVAFAVLALSFGVIVGLGMGLRQFLLLPLARGYLFPLISGVVINASEPGVLRNILIGEYGLLIKGIEWPFTLVLPYVLSFYLAMSILEDSGYLPRFAVLLDGAFSQIGLRGSHSISLLLGYGCAIPGILSTRAMGSRKQRIIVATLISLAVPCISQTGALFALLAEASIWLVPALFGLSFAVMIAAGILMDRLLPGERSQLVFEMPELLVPQARVMLQKVIGRLKHYLVDGAAPMVVAVGVAAVLFETGLLARLGVALSPLVTGWLRLPEAAAAPLLLGVVRRELTVLPLLEMELTSLQMFVGATVGLFYVPCIAVVATLSREFGLRAGFALLLLTTSTAFLIGGAFAQLGALW